MSLTNGKYRKVPRVIQDRCVKYSIAVQREYRGKKIPGKVDGKLPGIFSSGGVNTKDTSLTSGI
jgi:hypothetical protein